MMTTKTKPLRVGLIGCGFFAQTQLWAWQEIDGVELAAVCDIDQKKAQETARNFGITGCYNDAAKMLSQEKLDFVDIATTPPSHRSLVELCASHGVGVICQKPMAWTLEDAQAIVKACHQANVPFMVHENFRWQAPMREIRKLLDAGTIGKPFFGRISWRTGRDVFAAQPWLRETKRLIVVEVAVHTLDVARYLFGEPSSLFCHNVRVNPSLQGEDVSTIMLTMNGATCIVDCSFATRAAHDLFPETLITIEGSEGSLQLDADYKLQVSNSKGLKKSTIKFPKRTWSKPPWEVVEDSVVNIQQHWVNCLRAKEKPETSGEDNLRVLELVFGAYQSAEGNSVYHVNSTAEAQRRKGKR